MGRHTLRRSILTLVVTSLTGCWEASSDYCTRDDDCRDSTRSTHDPARPECHGAGHFCYEGCSSDKDCVDKGKPWYTSTRAVCDTATRDCVADLPRNLANGQRCKETWQCTSGYCVEGVCCVSACNETCRSCALSGSQGRCELVSAGADPRGDCKRTADACKGSCDGGGACAFPTKDTLCGAPSCASATSDATLTTPRCDGTGACVDEPVSCGGYGCATGNGSCKASCGGTSDCTGTFQCVGTTCVNSLPNGSTCGTNPSACKSGNCVDTVCCADKSCADCHSCNRDATTRGACTALADNAPAPAGQCKAGDAACQLGTCVAGKCAYKPGGSVCASPSCSAGNQTSSTCDATSHACVTGQKPCTPYVCNAATSLCFAGCSQTHAECLSTSVCDRSAAHTDPAGNGTCVAPGSVLVMSGGTLGAAVTAALGAVPPRSHLRVPAGTYAESITLPAGKSLSIVGSGTVTVSPGTTGNVPAFYVSGGTGTSLTLQGLGLTYAGNADDADGVRCSGTSSSNRAALTVLECTITKNDGQGVDATSCDVSLHRNTIQSNAGGGVKLSDGTFVVVNNLIGPSNGSGTSSFGGVNIQPGSSPPATFVNNTVASNSALSSATSGIQCGAGVTATNTIVWGNASGTTPQYSLCAFASSDVQGGATGAINSDPLFVDVSKSDFHLKTSPKSPCIDTAASTTVTTIDITGSTRLKGAGVDMGAYEMQ